MVTWRRSAGNALRAIPDVGFPGQVAIRVDFLAAILAALYPAATGGGEIQLPQQGLAMDAIAASSFSRGSRTAFFREARSWRLAHSSKAWRLCNAAR